MDTPSRRVAAEQIRRDDDFGWKRSLRGLTHLSDR
jgi:hypothetical protein